MYDINIPSDSIFDKSAPFNEVDYGDCLMCEGEGSFEDINGDIYDCDHCNGTGKKDEQRVREEYESHLESMKD